MTKVILKINVFYSVVVENRCVIEISGLLLSKKYLWVHNDTFILKKHTAPIHYWDQQMING